MYKSKEVWFSGSLSEKTIAVRESSFFAKRKDKC